MEAAEASELAGAFVVKSMDSEMPETTETRKDPRNPQKKEGKETAGTNKEGD